MSANGVGDVIPAAEGVEIVENSAPEVAAPSVGGGDEDGGIELGPYSRIIAEAVADGSCGVVPAIDGKGGGKYRYTMVLAHSDPTGALELPVDFGDYLYNDRGGPGFITVLERFDENSPRLVFDVRYRAFKHRAYVTKKTWSGFAADHGLQGGDEMSFEEHGDVFLLTAQRDGVALW